MRKNNTDNNKPTSHKKDNADAWLDWLTNDSETVVLLIIAGVIFTLLYNLL